MTDEIAVQAIGAEVASDATGTVFDITECAREPIHLLGSVQSHGALLALAEPDLTITVASANTAALLWRRRRGGFAGGRHSRRRRPGTCARQRLDDTSPR